MTNVYYLPTRKPSAEQLELPRAHITGILHDLIGALASAQLALMTADTADKFAQALTDTHKKLAEVDTGFAALVEATRDWR